METDSLHEVLEHCWRLLAKAAASASSPMHTPVLATVEDGAPTQRTVVLRRFDPGERLLICHTDRRSPKVAQIAGNPGVGWLFYDPALKQQIRVRGQANARSDGPLAEAQWSASQLGSRRCYLADPGPGARLPVPVSTLPEALRDRRPTESESLPGRKNFVVISTTVERLDWLWLGARGHRRASFSWSGGAMEAHWTAP